MTEVAVLAAVAATVALAAWWLRAREGRVVPVDAQLGGTVRERLGIPPGAAALVELTAPDCRTCAAARTVLDDVAGRLEGVRVVTADVAAHLDLAREHGVLRAPTTLVVDRRGRVRHRVHGVPDPGALAELLRVDVGVALRPPPPGRPRPPGRAA